MIYKTINQCIIWIFKNWIEIIGVILSIIMLPLEIARKWTFWIISICSSLFYIYINFNEKLYAMTGFCFYNIIISFYGLYCWKSIETKNNKNISFRFVTKSSLNKLISICLIIWLIIFSIIKFTYTITSVILLMLDTFITSLSIIAAWMSTKKIVESWILWLISDVCAVTVYINKKMYPSIFLYVIYSIFCVFGYIIWRKDAIKNL
ncbi:MAG: nicotinamide riboside transporter PnuC [Bacteroidales bacterium OttesenSCG-928-I14]|jgi:nicotinamide mononucleotide transporter|nr:nicotinamide riboside transporter PnuC [Bacteroidales bacterium OttesenSCG-928-I14]